MSVIATLQEYLVRSGVPYSHSVHPPAFTAREVAAAEHLSPQNVAKVVVLVIDNLYRMVVLPASMVVDLPEIRTVFEPGTLRLATEEELAASFPNCELGAMPPFGNLFGMPVFLDASLLRNERIAFNAGTHRDVIYMRLEDYRRVVKPEVVSLARALAF